MADGLRVRCSVCHEPYERRAALLVGGFVDGKFTMVPPADDEPYWFPTCRHGIQHAEWVPDAS